MQPPAATFYLLLILFDQLAKSQITITVSGCPSNWFMTDFGLPPQLLSFPIVRISFCFINFHHFVSSILALGINVAFFRPFCDRTISFFEVVFSCLQLCINRQFSAAPRSNCIVLYCILPKSMVSPK